MQERAARTRQGLVWAAASEFDRNGYAGSSLARIATSAGITTGALTFHFPSKQALAAAVRTEGHATTLAAVGQVAERPECPVQAVVALTLALAGLLEKEVAVRAAARLTREQSGGGPDWGSAWAPVIRRHLLDAERDAYDPAADRATLLALADHLVTGVEVDARQRSYRPGQLDGRSVRQLARIWELTLRGLGAGPDAPGHRAAEGAEALGGRDGGQAPRPERGSER